MTSSRFSFCSTLFTSAALLLVAGRAACHAAPVAQAQARAAIGNWLGRGGMPFNGKGGVPAGITSHADGPGRVLFHVARLDGGGFVVASADTTVKPVIAFSGGGEFDDAPGNPLFDVLMADLAERAPLARGFVPLGGGASPFEAEWDALLNPPPQPGFVLLSLNAVGDLRVAPLMQTKWGQSKLGSYSNTADYYNWKIPNLYPCGCVATLGAQIMRHHAWPQTFVQAKSFNCKVNGVAAPYVIQGGLYDWANMPVDPGTTFNPANPLHIAQRDAVSTLISDVAFSVSMSFAPGGSSASSTLLYARLADTFDFESVKLLTDSNHPRVFAQLRNAALANLDAGFPVGMDITGPSGGHAVAVDGYGYDNDDLYVHINMGWTGANDVWYNLPDVSGQAFDQPGAQYYFSFNIVRGFLYNIFPETAGEIISGRVFSHEGFPVEGASVVATNLTTGGVAVPARAATTGKGIYAVIIPPPHNPAHAWRIDAAFESASASVTTNIAASTSTVIVNDPNSPEYGYYYLNTGSVGNRWGVDVVLPAPSSDPPPAPPWCTSFTPGTNGVWNYVFHTPSAATLILEQKTNLAQMGWTGVGTNFYAAGTHTNVIPASSAPSRFFRTRIE